MTDISSLGHPFAHGQPSPVDRVNATSGGRLNEPGRLNDSPARAGEDRIELSENARLLDRMRQLPEIRQELVKQARAAIADGSYESPERLETAIHRMLEDVATEA